MLCMFLLAHHEWSLPVLWLVLGGGLTVAIAWLKARLMGHKHEHADGVEHTHPHEHDAHDHEH